MANEKNNKSMQKELKNLDAKEVLDFVLDKYHASEKRNLSSLNQCFQFMSAQELHDHPELTILRTCFTELRKLLQKHLTDSETIYFPAIRKNPTTSNNLFPFETEVHDVRENISRLFLEIQKLTNLYTPPSESSGWIKLCYALLHDLESDTKHHLYVEETILPLKLGA